MSKWTPRGRMRRLITIQSIPRTPTEDGGTTGESTADPTTVCKSWAMIEPFSGRESFLAKASQNLSTHRIRIPYRPGITPLMQATFDGRVFNFTSTNDIEEMHREIEILATEVVQAITQ
jgi:SPP1 family predicted phage head-tail adaptor